MTTAILRKHKIEEPLKRSIIKIDGTAYIINVTSLEKTPSDKEDHHLRGTNSYLVFADTEEDALDSFHNQIPIRNLDDFSIETFEVNSL